MSCALKTSVPLYVSGFRDSWWLARKLECASWARFWGGFLSLCDR